MPYSGTIPQNGKGSIRIAEVYRSIQGEGLLTGTESVFLRTSGCNLRCRFCDTPFASWHPIGPSMTLDELLGQVVDERCGHVVVTGGEPMLFPALEPLSERLRDAGCHITIETAGTRYLPVACDLMSISPKMSNSTPGDELPRRWQARHDRLRRAPQVIQRLIADYPYQLKFVIGSRRDCEEVQRFLEPFSGIRRERVMLMPLGTQVEELQRIGRWLEPYCQEHGLRFCPRRQIEWYGLRRGT